MKYIMLSCCLMLCGSLLTFGQHTQEHHSSSFQKLHTIKLQVVTKDMNLTAAQKKQFLPLYKEYTDKLHAVYREKRSLKNNGNSTYVVNERLRLDQQIVSIKKEYKSRFLNIITADQLEQMYRGEEQFKRMLIQRLKQKH